MRSLLRWAGSKRQVLPVLKSYWIDPTLRYIEPFAGSACLFFHIEPKRALLNDINSNLVGFYRQVKKSPADVYKRASNFARDKETYYRIRKAFQRETDPTLSAAQFFYLNRFCFNGIYRTNERGEFNVPYSGSKTGGFPSFEEFSDAVRVLRHARTESMDFEALLRQEVSAGDFVYLDPPYAVANRRVFRQYNASTFGTGDIERLSDILTFIDKKQAKFVLSYAYCREAVEHFSHWQHRRIRCQRNIAGFASNRRKAVELVVSNFDPTSSQDYIDV